MNFSNNSSEILEFLDKTYKNLQEEKTTKVERKIFFALRWKETKDIESETECAEIVKFFKGKNIPSFELGLDNKIAVNSKKDHSYV